jgi:hypothetical protein
MIAPAERMVKRHDCAIGDIDQLAAPLHTSCISIEALLWKPNRGQTEWETKRNTAPRKPLLTRSQTESGISLEVCQARSNIGIKRVSTVCYWQM